MSTELPNSEPPVEASIVPCEVMDLEKPQPLPLEFKNRRGQRRLENITVKAIESFLDNLSQTGLLMRSAELCGLAYSTIYRLRKDEPEFQAMCEEAMERYRDSLEAEAHRRAVEGWDEPVFSQRLGTMIGTIHKYDSRLLELMLKRHRPEYRERFEGEVKITGGVLVAPIAPINLEDWQKSHSGEKLHLLSDEKQDILPPDQTQENK